jgi:hypothetical protein
LISAGRLATLVDAPPFTLPLRIVAWEAIMTVSCPCCGISIEEQVLRCPLCDTSLVRSNLRRALLWAFVLEEYALVAALVLLRT